MNDRHYTEREVDFAYLMGVFNVSGIDGLHKEIQRLKSLSIEPHDIIIAAAEEGGMSEKPTSHSEPIKSDYYSLREYFEQCREAETMLKDGRIIITKTTQDDICNLVDNPHKPSVPSVEEIEAFFSNYNKEWHDNPDMAIILHQWLTERARL